MFLKLGFPNLAIRDKARYKCGYLLVKLSKSVGT